MPMFKKLNFFKHCFNKYPLSPVVNSLLMNKTTLNKPQVC